MGHGQAVDILLYLFGETARTKDTLDYATAVAFIGAVIAAVGFVLKDIWSRIAKWLEGRARFKSAVIRFHNDVRVWQDDYKDSYNDDQLDRLVATVLREDENFKFSIPASDSTDIRLLNRYMHRLNRVTMQVVRTYVVYYELVMSMNEKLGTQEFADMSRQRKIGAIITLFQYASVVEQIGRKVEDKLLPLTHIRKRGSKHRTELEEALETAKEKAGTDLEKALEKLKEKANGHPTPAAQPVALSAPWPAQPIKAMVEVDLSSNTSLPVK
ncbi:MAG: hypothetical protein AAFR71_10100 [Pseudomonadota bacterium]